MNPQEVQNPTLAEVYRLVQRNETESRDHRQEILSYLKEIKEAVDTTQNALRDTENIVGTHSEAISEMKNSITNNSNDIAYFKGREKWIFGAFAVIVVVSASVPFFFKLYIQSVVSESIASALSKNK